MYEKNEFINRIVEKEEISKNYVQLDGVSLNFKYFEGAKKFILPITDEVLENYHGWLEDNIRDKVVPQNLYSLFNQWLESEKRVLILIGEYGTGKTTSLEYFQYQKAVELHKGDFDHVTSQRLPIILYLRDFESSLEPFLLSQFNHQGIEKINFIKIKERSEQGEFLFILDGFDEISQHADDDEKIKKFNKLKSLIEFKNSKIIISVRKEYFKSQNEFYECFNLNSNFDYSIIETLPFSPKQIKEFFKIKSSNPEKYFSEMENIFDLKDLAQRPVLLDLIVTYLPELIKTKAENITSVDLYEYCIKKELLRKESELKFKLPSSRRLAMLKDISLILYENNTLSFSISDLKEHLEAV